MHPPKPRHSESWLLQSLNILKTFWCLGFVQVTGENKKRCHFWLWTFCSSGVIYGSWFFSQNPEYIPNPDQIVQVWKDKVWVWEDRSFSPKTQYTSQSQYPCTPVSSGLEGYTVHLPILLSISSSTIHQHGTRTISSCITIFKQPHKLLCDNIPYPLNPNTPFILNSVFHFPISLSHS